MKSIVLLLIFALTGSNSLNWVGQFRTIDQCNQAQCCCLVGDIELSELSQGVLNLRADLLGVGCPTTGKLDVRMNQPTGLSSSYSVESDTIVIELSQDSQSINTHNTRLPNCVNQAERLEDNSTSIAPSTSTVHTRETTTLPSTMVANTTGPATPASTGHTGPQTTTTISNTGFQTTETIQNTTMSAANQLASKFIYPNLLLTFLFFFY